MHGFVDNRRAFVSGHLVFPALAEGDAYQLTDGEWSVGAPSRRD